MTPCSLPYGTTAAAQADLRPTGSAAAIPQGFENSMLQIWQFPHRSALACQQPQQTVVNLDEHCAEGVHQPLVRSMELLCERMEGSLNRVADRLEISFDRTLCSRLPIPSQSACQPQTLAQCSQDMAKIQGSQNCGLGGRCVNLLSTPEIDKAVHSGSVQVQVDNVAEDSSKKSIKWEDNVTEDNNKKSIKWEGNVTEDDGKKSITGDVFSPRKLTAAASSAQNKSECASIPEDSGGGVLCVPPFKDQSFVSTFTSVDVGHYSSTNGSATARLVPPRHLTSDHDYIDGVIRHSQWEIGQLQKGDTTNSWFEKAYRRKLQEKTTLHHMLIKFGYGHILLHEAPKNFLVDMASSEWFHGCAAIAVILCTIFSAYEADQACRISLNNPRAALPDWWYHVDLGFNMLFTAELLIRIVGYRAWFFFDPVNWRWNLFDTFVLTVSMINTASAGIDLYFVRLLRTMRVICVARVFRVANFFSELRKLLFAIVASIASLLWAALFLLLTMFVFSILILQGISSEVKRHTEDDELIEKLRAGYNGIMPCIKKLFIVGFGDDWVEPHLTLSNFGIIYSLIMPTFVVFVNFGVMNIIVGVFAEAFGGCRDRDLIAQEEISNVEDFIETILVLWNDFAGEDADNAEMDWECFRKYFYQEEVQAYLHYHHIDASHAHLLFEQCDRNKNNKLDSREFVLGLLRCKGSAKHLHTEVLLKMLWAMSQNLDCIRQDLRAGRQASGSNVLQKKSVSSSGTTGKDDLLAEQKRRENEVLPDKCSSSVLHLGSGSL